MTSEEWASEFVLLQKRGIRLTPGLTERELECAEQIHGFRFPPDLRALLASALPIAPGFPDWRAPNSPELVNQLAWPFDGMAFDIEHSTFWWNAWGPRPAELLEAIAAAKVAVAIAPRLIPVCGHRYLPAEPALAGNPVLSVYQTDIIYYGTDLRRYLACEFGSLDYASATSCEPRRIRFWSDLVEDNA